MSFNGLVLKHRAIERRIEGFEANLYSCTRDTGNASNSYSGGTSSNLGPETWAILIEVSHGFNEPVPTNTRIIH
jgi:hypothetical protein